MAKVFISYRRADSATISGRIYDRLAARFGRTEIFKDVDDIPPGVNFVDYIQTSLRQCAVMLALIGPHWLGATAADGRRRLDGADDLVRREIEAALDLGLVVIPVLVEDARMPRAADLPESLRPLALINAVSVHNDPYFDHDIQRLIGAVDRALSSEPPPKTAPVRNDSDFTRDMERPLFGVDRDLGREPPTLGGMVPAAPPSPWMRPPVEHAHTPMPDHAFPPAPPFSGRSTLAAPRAPVPLVRSRQAPRRARTAGVAMLLAVLVAGGVLLVRNLPHGTSGGHTSGASVTGKDCKHIGYLLPDSTDVRWEAEDHPDVVAALHKYLPGATVDVANAAGSSATQQTQADSELARGACILIIAAVDSFKAGTIVADAKAKNVPVIAYDRMIDSDSLSYYVSFDDFATGVAQAQYIKDHYQRYVAANGTKNLIMIDGSDVDSAALLFSGGAHSVLDPLVAAGSLRKVYEQRTPGWDPSMARSEMEAALTANNNQVAVAYVMNDGMADAVITALKARNLAGKVLVTGQDAEVVGIRNILLGYQSMTVYKPISKLADSVGKLVAAVSKGASTAALANQRVKNPNGTASIPAVLNDGVTVDITNIKTTVVADGVVHTSDICNGLPSGTGGICP